MRHCVLHKSVYLHGSPWPEPGPGNPLLHQLSTIPAISADTDSTGIVEALPKMPDLSKIFIFWICMCDL